VIEVVEISAIPSPMLDTFDEMPAQAAPGIPARGVSHALFDAVREVALVAAVGDLDAARLVSKSRWNASREAAGYPDLPTADAMRVRFGVPEWSMVLAVVFHEQTKRFQLLGTLTKRIGALGPGARTTDLEATRDETSDLLDLLSTDDLIAGDAEASLSVMAVSPSADIAARIIQHALRAVAYRLDRSPTIDQYDSMMVRIERERFEHGLPALGFPTSRTIISRYGSWARALTDVGLGAPVVSKRESGLPVVVVLDACIDEWGVLPGKEAFRRWAKTCGLSVQRMDDRWADVVAEVRRLRADRGLKTPDLVTSRLKELPPLPSPDQAAMIRARLGGPRRIMGRRPATDVEESLQIYAEEHLRPGQKPSQRNYMEACRADKRLMWPSGLVDKSGKNLTTLFREAGL
jgi:hypothetical protein